MTVLGFSLSSRRIRGLSLRKPLSSSCLLTHRRSLANDGLFLRSCATRGWLSRNSWKFLSSPRVRSSWAHTPLEMLSPKTKLSARDRSKFIVLILSSSFSSTRIVIKATTVPFPIWGKLLKDPSWRTNFFTQVGKKYVAQIFSNNLNVISGQNLILADLKRFNPAWRNFSDPARKILSSQSGRVFLWALKSKHVEMTIFLLLIISAASCEKWNFSKS